MKILHVTDLHFSARFFDWLSREVPKHDVTCATGDFLNMFADFAGNSPMRIQAAYVRKFLAGVGHPIFCCSGNHDYEHDFLQEAAGDNPNVRADGTDEIFGGFRFICWPWSQTWFPKLDNLAEPVVLLSHAPPESTGLSTGEMGDAGSVAVRFVAKKLPPGSIVLSGHAHSPTNWAEKIGNVWCFNPGGIERAAFPNHLAIDTRLKMAELRSAEDHDFPTLIRL